MLSRLSARSFALALFLSLSASTILLADDDDGPRADAKESSGDSRYGLFGLLDHRSAYGHEAFPEPFLVEDTDGEDLALRVDWFHAKAGSTRTDIETVELEKGFGLLTFQLSASYEHTKDSDDSAEGANPVELSARYPLFQYVSAKGFFDSSFGAMLTVGVPTNSPLGRNTSLEPAVFEDIRLGTHVTLQSIVGYSTLFGPGPDGGLHECDYGVALAYTFHRNELPGDVFTAFSPLVEISGEKQLNHVGRENSILATAGFRLHFKTVGPFQPRLGLAYVFPLNQAARDEVHHGIYTSMVFEF